ncbi:hypothetical protein HPB50_026259 [Hyalomma asiaticum]|uniref:Uncharacterized protein n=1 Tax=Hyalomma asiaticum TaxID=266040 RepID=A0ACB7SND4_HYAAI|nr:hypothetical protein HPB50_026259 [Hyalomma asiaticum]
MQAVLSLVLAWLSSVPDRHTSPVPPFRSFGFDYGSRTNASFLDANNFLDATSVVQLPPGYPAPASASSVVRVELNCRPPDTLFSGHGNSIGSVVLNQHVFAMQFFEEPHGGERQAFSHDAQIKFRARAYGYLLFCFCDLVVFERHCLPEELSRKAPCWLVGPTRQPTRTRTDLGPVMNTVR